MENRDRKIEISSKLIQMGRSLLEEGQRLDDTDLMKVGNNLVLLSGLMLNPKDLDEFNNLCAMFTSKQILDEMMESPLGAMFRNSSLGNLDEVEKDIQALKKKPNQEGDKLGDNLSD